MEKATEIEAVRADLRATQAKLAEVERLHSEMTLAAIQRLKRAESAEAKLEAAELKITTLEESTAVTMVIRMKDRIERQSAIAEDYRKRALEAESALARATGRLNALHTPLMTHDGYELGIYAVKWENGNAVSVLQTCADFREIDAAMSSGGTHG